MKKSKIFVSLISVAVMASTCVMGAFAAHYKGDVNRDDKVTAADIVTIQKFLTGKTSIEKDKLIYLDMNDDNKINVFDLIEAKRVAIGEEKPEEVPSLTTPAETTVTTTTTTTTSATTVTTTPATTTKETTTTAATTQATTVTSTAVATESTTVTQTVIVTEATTAAVTTAEITTATEATTTTAKATETSVESTTEATTTTAKPSETSVESTTEAATTTAKPSETSVESTTEATTTEAVSTTAKPHHYIEIADGQTENLELDSTRDVDFIEIEFDKTSDFNFHAYIDNWTAHFNINNYSETLTETNLKNVESVTIDGNRVKIEFAEGVSGENLYLKSDGGEIYITVSITYVGEEVTEPEVTTTTTTTSAMVEETTTTTTTTTTTAVESEETTTTITTTDETEQTSFILDANKVIELDADKELDTLTVKFDTSNDFVRIAVQFGEYWDAFIDVNCSNGVLSAGNYSSDTIESLTFENGEMIVKFKAGVSRSTLTLHAPNYSTTPITIFDYNITYATATE